MLTLRITVNRPWVEGRGSSLREWKCWTVFLEMATSPYHGVHLVKVALGPSNLKTIAHSKVGWVSCWKVGSKLKCVQIGPSNLKVVVHTQIKWVSFWEAKLKGVHIVNYVRCVIESKALMVHQVQLTFRPFVFQQRQWWVTGEENCLPWLLVWIAHWLNFGLAEKSTSYLEPHGIDTSSTFSIQVCTN